jgi:hypothetical protein
MRTRRPRQDHLDASLIYREDKHAVGRAMHQRVSPIADLENELFNTNFIIVNFVLIFKMTIANITCLSKNALEIVEKFRNYSGYFGNIKILIAFLAVHLPLPFLASLIIA